MKKLTIEEQKKLQAKWDAEKAASDVKIEKEIKERALRIYDALQPTAYDRALAEGEAIHYER